MKTANFDTDAVKYTKDLAHLLAETLGLPYSQVYDHILPAVLSGILTLSDESGLTLTNFGVFTRWDRPARTGRNPKTGQAIPVPPTSTLRFRASKGLIHDQGAPAVNPFAPRDRAEDCGNG